MAGKDEELLVKLLILGDSAVGKSSLLMRFSEERFDSAFVLTIGVDFKCKSVVRNGKRLKLQIWDTAGQERFRTITPAYYRTAMGVVIVYDVTLRETFDHVEFWVEQLNQHGNDGVQWILVGNKSDLVEHRKVATEEGSQLASRFGMNFFETSAYSGDQVEPAFLSIADQVVSHRYGELEGAARPGADVQLKSGSKKGCQCCGGGKG